MGCVPNRTKIKIYSPQFHSLSFYRKNALDKNPLFLSEIDFSSKISKNKWIHIFNYLNYNELKEIGKVCKYFQICSFNQEILIKFFKKRPQKTVAYIDSTPFTSLNQDFNFSPFKNDLTNCQLENNTTNIQSFVVLQNISGCALDECDNSPINIESINYSKRKFINM